MDSCTATESTMGSCPSRQHNQEHEIAFLSFGGAVLDEIRIGHRVIAQQSLGGAGTHATLGARLFLAPGHKVAWQLQAGEDFPLEIESRPQQWGIRLSVRRTPGVMSTRNVVTYHDESLGAKTFSYLTPIISLTPKDVMDKHILSAQAVHFHVHPEKLKAQIQELRHLRGLQDMALPTMVWEPTRPSCVPAHLDACFELAKLVDVFSPNHDELAALHGKSFSEFRQQDFEALADKFVDSGIGSDGNGIIVVRAGEHGALLRSSALASTWVPPFYERCKFSINPKVVDTTGAGNTFLGGFAVGYLISGDAVTAAQYGSVAASYMVEQLGLPKVTFCDESAEKWNGTDVKARLKEFQARCAASTC